MKKLFLFFSLLTIVFTANAQTPVINFNVSPDTAMAGSLFTFTNTSTGFSNITAFSWSFGDICYNLYTSPIGADSGHVCKDTTIGIVPTITHIYYEAGFYTVTLLAKDGLGTIYSFSKTVLVMPAALSACNSGTNCDLICNGQFENHVCFGYSAPDIGPHVLGFSTVDYWSNLHVTGGVASAVSGTPDYYDDHTCTNSAGVVESSSYVPYNDVGCQPDHSTGKAYIGLYTYYKSFGSSVDYREYATSRLNMTMVAGQDYKVTYWVSLAEMSNTATTAPSAYFSASAPSQSPLSFIGGTSGYNVINVSPSSLYLANAASYPPVTDKNGWTLITFNYHAQINENYITLGNFSNDATTAKTPVAVIGNCYPTEVSQLTAHPEDVNGSYYYIDDISITPLNDVLTLTASRTSVCLPIEGDVLLTASGGGGTGTYSWSASPGGSISAGGGNVIEVNPLVTTTYTVTSYDPVYGCSQSKTITITVNIPPVITVTGVTTICTGAATTLIASAATTYSWLPGGETTQSITVNPTSTTTYTITETNGTSGACTATSTVTVTVDPTCCTGEFTYTATHNTISSLRPTGSFVNRTIGFDGTATVLYIDINTSITNHSAVLCTPNLTIDIKPGVTLTVSNSSLYSCGLEMWNGIIIEPGANLIIEQNSLIEDAKTAILSDNTAGIASFTIKKTNFNRNYIAVEVDNYTGTGTPFLISNSTFGSATSTTSTVNSQLLDMPYSSQTAEIGVKLSNVNTITIGDVSVASYANNFNAFLRTGIFSQNSSYSAYNNKFNGLYYSQPCATSTCPTVGWAIYNTNATASGNSTITIGGNGTNQANSFQLVSNGIFHGAGGNQTSLLYVINNTFKTIQGITPSVSGTAIKTTGFNQGGLVDIENNDMENMTIGSFHTNNFQTKYIALNNTLKNFTPSVGAHSAGGIAVYCLQNNGGSMNISSNTFNQSATSTYIGNTAIEVNNAIIALTASPVVNINGNSIFRVNQGIYLTDINNPQVTSNNIAFASGIVPTPTNFYYGIRSMNSDNENILSNTISKNGSANPTISYENAVYGISVESNATATSVLQNTVTQVGNGLNFYNYSNANSTIKCNYMNQDWDGLTLGGGVNIGTQGASTIISPPDGIANDNIWTTIPPAMLTAGSRSIKGFSYVFVTFYTRSAGFPYTPPPATDMTPAGAVNIVFVPLSPSTCTVPCHTPPCARIALAKIARNENPFNLVTGTQRFTMQEGLLRGVLADTIPLDTTTADGRDLQAFIDTTTTNANVGKLVIVSTKLASGDTLGAQSLNNSITPNQCADEYHKTVNTIFLNTWAMGNFNITPPDSITLYNIAVLNPFDCGTAIYDARVMLGIQINDYTTDESRMMEITPTANAVPDNVGVLYPNPAENSCTYEATLSDTESGLIVMCDLNGKLISSYKLNNGYNKVAINLSDYSNGIYLYKIFINGKQADYKKLVIAK